MAAREDSDRSVVGRLLSWLAVPRLVTLPVLLIVGAAIGWGLWRSIDSVKILAWFSGVASPFCTMCATVVWAMRGKLEDTLNTEEMSDSVYQKFVALNEKHRNRSTLMASVVALMSLVAAMPAISNQLIGPVWEVSVVVAGMAVAVSIYGYLMANYWDLQIRRYKHQQVLQSKRDAAEITKFEDASHLANPSPLASKLGRGWSNGPSLREAPQE